jgi:hypothetical protein
MTMSSRPIRGISNLANGSPRSMSREATSKGAAVVVGGTVVEVLVDVVDVDVDVLLAAVVVEVAAVVVVVGADAVVVIDGVVVATDDVGAVDGRPADSINSSNWFSARSCARANSMPVPHSW